MPTDSQPKGSILTHWQFIGIDRPEQDFPLFSPKGTPIGMLLISTMFLLLHTIN
jgi:hypothetical protein